MDPTMGNSSETKATGNETAASFSEIMGNMTTQNKPEVKPNADAAEGKETDGINSAEPDKMPAWTSQLPEDLRSNKDVMKQLTKFSKIGDLAKSYSELEGKLGSSLTKPADDASEEDINAFYQKLGKPATAEEYDIKDKNAEEFKILAYKNNLTNAQAKAVYEELKLSAEQMVQQQQKAQMQKAAETEAALKEEYGNKYVEKLQMLQRGVTTYGGNSLGDKLKNTGLLYDTEIAKMFILLGEQASEADIAQKNTGKTQYVSIADGGFMDFGKDFD